MATPTLNSFRLHFELCLETTSWAIGEHGFVKEISTSTTKRALHYTRYRTMNICFHCQKTIYIISAFPLLLSVKQPN
ncbi:hypothetical protein SNE40_011413 [Patella caerulea]|uniref:Uncharacterized protein n=1 Tax=Patella caerulea TaxID=87958 RepID=A0AAN8JMN0_PATCE